MEQRKAEKTAEQVSTENSFASVAAQWLEHWKDDMSARHGLDPATATCSRYPVIGVLASYSLRQPAVAAIMGVPWTKMYHEHCRHQ
jgi:hypothetical protein